MKTLREFLNEVKKQYLYHTTSDVAFNKIYADGYLRSDQGGGFKSWISFTRSKHYMIPQHILGGKVRFVYDYDKIKQRYKTKPKADLSVLATDRTRLSQIDSKYESEELVKGPIPISKQAGLVAIETDSITKEFFVKHIKQLEETVASTLEKIKMLDQNMFWHNNSKEWREITTPKQKRMFNLENYEKKLEASKEALSFYKDMMNDSTIKWGILK